MSSNLTCRYHRVEAVTGVTFKVEPGTVFALLGPNGAGKTTTIRALMNIIRPSGGEARVLGIDSRHLGPRQLETIGYVSENQKMPGWMTLGELLAYCRPFYPTWDDALCRKLVDDFGLPLDTKIGRMSRGMRVKAALITALAYRPRLLVLDEPFSGLDPVVREDSFMEFWSAPGKSSGACSSRPTTSTKSSASWTRWPFLMRGGSSSRSRSRTCRAASGGSK